MKNTLNLLAGGLVFGTMLIWQSCGDPCKDVVCQNGGTPTEADKECNCVCATGYEGTSCETEMRTKFIKTASSVSESCGTSTYSYTTDIVAGSAINEIKIKNLGNYNCTGGDYYVVATVDGTNLTITSQTVCSTNFSGSGTYSSTDSKVTVTFTAVYGSTTDNCTDIFN